MDYPFLTKIYAKATGSFKIPPKLKPHLKVNGNLSDVGSWKAEVWLNNSGHKKKGTLDDVGYVGFDYKTGTVVPVARADEHHVGYDLMSHLEAKGLIPTKKWVMIWAQKEGGNYAYQEELEGLVPVVKKWLELGGYDLTYSLSDSHHQIKFSELVKNGAVLKEYRGELSPIGKQLINLLETVATLQRRSLSGSIVSSKQLSYAVSSIVKFVEEHALAIAMLGFNTREGIPKLKEAAAYLAANKITDKDDDHLDVVLGFNGLKNALHKELKRIIEGTETLYAKYAKQLFGDDLELALKELNRISAI